MELLILLEFAWPVSILTSHTLTSANRLSCILIIISYHIISELSFYDSCFTLLILYIICFEGFIYLLYLCVLYTYFPSKEVEEIK